MRDDGILQYGVPFRCTMGFSSLRGTTGFYALVPFKQYGVRTMGFYNMGLPLRGTTGFYARVPFKQYGVPFKGHYGVLQYGVLFKGYYGVLC